jgi:hypothetical protein
LIRKVEVVGIVDSWLFGCFVDGRGFVGEEGKWATYREKAALLLAVAVLLHTV